MLRISTTDIRVRYRETDQMGVAWHGNYIEWFEIARLDWWRQQGLSYRELEERGFRLPVLKVCCEYRQASHFDDRLHVAVQLATYNGLRIVFSYRVTRPEDGTLIALGETEHAFTNQQLRPLRVDRNLPDVHAALSAVL